MHAARSLTPTERNYSQVEKEGLALIFAVKKFLKMLFGCRFTILTDHKQLLSIFSSKKGIPVNSVDYNARQSFYWYTISTYSTARLKNLVRLISLRSVPDDDTVIAAINIKDGLQRALTDCIQTIPVTRVDIKREIQHDPMIQKVRKFLRHSSFPDLTGNCQQFKLSIIDHIYQPLRSGRI